MSLIKSSMNMQIIVVIHQRLTSITGWSVNVEHPSLTSSRSLLTRSSSLIVSIKFVKPFWTPLSCDFRSNKWNKWYQCHVFISVQYSPTFIILFCHHQPTYRSDIQAGKRGQKKKPVSKFLHGVADWPYKHVSSVLGVIFVAEKIWPLRNPKFAQIFRPNKLSRFQTFKKHIKNCV